MANWGEIKELANAQELMKHFDEEIVQDYVDYVPELLTISPAVLQERLSQVKEKLGDSWASILELDAEGDEYLFLWHLCSDYEGVWEEALQALRHPREREWSFAEALAEYGAVPDIQAIDEIYGIDLLYLLDSWQDEVCANVAYLQSIGIEEVGEVLTRWPHLFICFDNGLEPEMEKLKAQLGETYVEQLNENLFLYEMIL
ncbi:MAG: hypothetical protein IKU83_05085 [Lachnospiraceae bacterium]|nr:hypothetical protein [Lachnospiraceae bacterium]